MAAVDPSESPTQQRSHAAEGETSGGKAEPTESGCSVADKDETAENPGDERAASAGSHGGRAASHSGVSVGSGAGADKTTGKSQGELTSAVNMAEAPGDEPRAFAWSETEDDDDGETRIRRGITKCDPPNAEEPAKVGQCNSHAGDTSADASREDECSQSNQNEAEAPVAKDSVGSVNGLEVVAKAEEESGRGGDAGSTAKQKHCRLVCKECGKRFTRREMFNLHRHFHAHEDELTPLTCKQCGLTFQHRSSLIKHRNEHKAKVEQPLTPNDDVQNKELGSFTCAECERTFSTVDKLRNHNCSNTVEKPYHCPLCRQEFQFKLSVTKHMMTHSQESLLTCQVCSQTFPSNMALRYHQRCHTALKPYECPECGMVFKHYSVMEDHRRRHTDSARSHLCNICEHEGTLPPAQTAQYHYQ
ncbi:zinc finger protein 91 isoform X2 [Betta splendens]|uniref:Zinc finger protein 91 isoform X2 n=1 Tax=Betta splendens TaxID=158456 RepID=A0A9W2XCF8_BETSP|nr:zinc finger protein 91 isoform X2 [Betta splendens]